jgi:hypothetical protein
MMKDSPLIRAFISRSFKAAHISTTKRDVEGIALLL